MFAVDDKTIEGITSGYFIPPRPDILLELDEVMREAEPDPVRVAETIAHDVGLSGAILKTINSPLFGMSRTISDIRQAAVLLGVRNVVSITTAYAMRRALCGEACISLERFWDSADEVAGAMVAVGRLLGLKIPPEDLYAAGLFHDSGIPVLAMKHDDYKELLIRSNGDHQRSIVDYEEEAYGTNHAVVGYFVASSWGMPRELCQFILQHHNRELTRGCKDEALGNMVAIIKLVENMVHRLRRLTDDADWPHFQEFVFFQLGLRPLNDP